MSIKTAAVVALLAGASWTAGCAEEQPAQRVVGADDFDVEVFESDSGRRELHAVADDGEILATIRLDTGEVRQPAEDWNEGELMPGRRLVVGGMGVPSYDVTTETLEGRWRLRPRGDQKVLLADPRVQPILEDWGIEFDWSLMTQVADADAFGEWHYGSHHVLAAFNGWGGVCSTNQYTNSTANHRWTETGWWDSSLSACHEWDEGNGTGWRRFCYRGDLNALSQWCSGQCLTGSGGQARTCTGGGGQCGGVSGCSTCSCDRGGQCNGGVGFCQVNVGWGWTGPLGCTMGNVEVGGPLTYCSSTNGGNEIHYHTDYSPSPICGDQSCDAGEEGWCCSDCPWTCNP